MSTKITTDIYLAAALLALGAKLEKTDKTDPRHMEFHFSAPAESTVKITPPLPYGEGVVTNVGSSTLTTSPGLNLDALETEWVNKTMKINAFEFAEAIKRMKSVVHSRTA